MESTSTSARIVHILIFVDKPFFVQKLMCHPNNYLIDSGIYYSCTHLGFSVSAFLYHAFTVLYSHNQHAYATSVKVFVNIRCFKKWRSFICAISAPSFDKNNHYTTCTVSQSAIMFQAKIRVRFLAVTSSEVRYSFIKLNWHLNTFPGAISSDISF